MNKIFILLILLLILWFNLKTISSKNFYKKKSKIAVCMFYNDGIKDYADYSYKINKKYCDKYNLDLIVSKERKYTDKRSPAWEKVLLVLYLLKKNKYKYVIWIDADAFFYLDSSDIRTVIKENKTKDFIFSADGDGRNDIINSGIFIVKNSNYSKKLMEIWAYDKKVFKEGYVNNGWWEQNIINYMYKNNIKNIRERSKLEPFNKLQHFEYNNSNKEKPFICHFAGKKKEIRKQKIKDYYDKIKDK